MSTAPIANSNDVSLDTSNQAQRRSSSLMSPTTTAGLPPCPRSPHATGSAGPDVTPTSPSGSESLVSIRPLPPGMYQPSLDALPEGESLVSAPRPSMAPFPSSAPPIPPASPLPSHMMSESATGVSASTGTGKHKENTGRWLAEEHEVFLKGLKEHGKQWKKIAVMIKTRSVVQVRTHAQKYFQKLLKNEKKEDGRLGKDRSSSISTSTATSTSTAMSTITSTSTAAAPIKRKSSIKGNKTTATMTTAAKKRRVSLEPKPKKQAMPAYHHPQPPLVHVAPAPSADHTVIDPSFMSTLADGEFDETLLELLDDSSVEAVEQVIGSDYDDEDMEPNPVEPNPVSPSVSSMSLADASGSGPKAFAQCNTDAIDNRQELVTSPNPEDFTIHNTIGTSSVSGRELSPTSVACMMDIKDFEQKTSNYVDALDWLMDVGVYQLPAPAGEQEEDWGNGTTAPAAAHTSAAATTAIPVAPQQSTMSAIKLAQVNSSALSVLDNDVF